MSHYDNEREADIESRLKPVETAHYTAQNWYDEIRVYLIDVMGMNEQQVAEEFKRHFPKLAKEIENNE